MFFWFAVVLVFVFALLFLLGFEKLSWIPLAISAFVVLVPLPIAWFDCNGPAGGSTTGAETCPECGQTNRVWPWSL
ncbi:hypothetical protein C2E31_13500 [Rhodopirellula baltica]|nr:hypothetical protein C2E31_13500 [Rhodopirellula baltica]